jgi:hypothetical protein
LLRGHAQQAQFVFQHREPVALARQHQDVGRATPSAMRRRSSAPPAGIRA